MTDDLKNFVDQNRSEFELFKPDHDEIWSGVERRLAKRSIWVVMKPYTRLAAGIALIASFMLFYYQYGTSTSGALETAELRYLSPELGETENYYQGLINEKMEFVKAHSDVIDPVILEDIDLLDQAFTELKDDLADNADNEEVVNAMIKNYRIKLEILERILAEIENNDEPEYDGSEI